jgi:hypothetical protein
MQTSAVAAQRSNTGFFDTLKSTSEPEVLFFVLCTPLH